MTYQRYMGSKEEATIKNWTELINKSVHSADDIDIGDIKPWQRSNRSKKGIYKHTLLIYTSN